MTVSLPNNGILHGIFHFKWKLYWPLSPDCSWLDTRVWCNLPHNIISSTGKCINSFPHPFNRSFTGLCHRTVLSLTQEYGSTYLIISFPLLVNVSTVFPILSIEASLDFVTGLFLARHDSMVDSNCIRLRASTL